MMNAPAGRMPRGGQGSQDVIIEMSEDRRSVETVPKATRGYEMRREEPATSPNRHDPGRFRECTSPAAIRANMWQKASVWSGELRGLVAHLLVVTHDGPICADRASTPGS